MEEHSFTVGAIVSADYTVTGAPEVRDFYQQVIGWKTEDMPMKDGEEDYADYIMQDADGNWAGGVCHRRGINQDLPRQWIVYINVADIGESLKKCAELGGKVLKESKNAEGVYVFAIIEDPSGGILGITKMG
jgi:uncharacterized protein